MAGLYVFQPFCGDITGYSRGAISVFIRENSNLPARKSSIRFCSAKGVLAKVVRKRASHTVKDTALVRRPCKLC